MAVINTTFANLKINALRKAGNNYSANDATLLTIAGGLINEILGSIGTLIKGHPFTLDIGNTVSTVASQAYVALTDTDIVEVLQVYQRVTNRKLKQITYAQYIDLAPDPTRFAGNPDLAFAPTQAITNGQMAWTLYLLPTPSSVITLYYDYLKSMKFSADGTTADTEYCPLPPTYDAWIYSEFKPLLYEIMDPNNRSRIQSAKEQAQLDRSQYMTAILSQADRWTQVGSARDTLDYRYNRVATTPIP